MATKRNRIEEAKEKGEYRLKQALAIVRTGEFIEIKRESKRAEMSVVAHRFTGDMERFQKIVRFAFDDAASALHDGQWLTILITS